MSSFERVRAYIECRAWLVAAALCLALVKPAWAPSEARAQAAPAYDQIPLPADLAADERLVKSRILFKNNVIKGGLNFEENRAQLDDFYKQYLFRAFTSLKDLKDLPTRRRDVRRDLMAARDPAIHNHVVNLLFGGMKVLVTYQRYKFHPAVRYNAMLVIGDLNRREPSVQNRLPEPWPDALVFMVTEFNNPDQLEIVKLAAQLGILRHVTLSRAPGNQPLPPNAQNAIARAMMPLATADEPPAGRSASGHAWMRGRAIEILAMLGQVGPNSELNQALEAIVHNADEEMTLRCTAAAALQHARPAGQQPPNLDTPTVSLKLGALAAQVCRAEIDRIDEQLEKNKRPQPGGGGYGGMYSGMMGEDGGMSGYESDYMSEESAYEEMYESGMGGGMDMGMGMESGMMGMYGSGMPGVAAKKDPELDRHRRRVKTRLLSVQKGLSGLAQLATADPDKTKVGEVVAKVDDVMTATDPPEDEPTLEALKEQLRTAVAPLEALTRAVTPPPAAEPAVSDEPVPDTPVAAPAVPETVAPAVPEPAPSEPAPASSAPPKPASAPSAPAAPTLPAKP